MRTEPYYRQLPKFSVVGLTLKLQSWRFSCGAIDPADPLYIFRDLPPLDIVFTADPTFDKFATLYIVPMALGGDNYYLTEWNGNPALAQTANSPTEKWTPDISVVSCLNIVIRAGATTLEVTANEFDPGEPPDQRREVQTKAGQVKAWKKGNQPEGWELLDTKKHKRAFPISLGRLKRGEMWYILTPEAEEKIRNSKVKIQNSKVQFKNKK